MNRSQISDVMAAEAGTSNVVAVKAVSGGDRIGRIGLGASSRPSAPHAPVASPRAVPRFKPSKAGNVGAKFAVRKGFKAAVAGIRSA